MQNRHRDDERQEKPVGDIDMRFFTVFERHHENSQIGHPDKSQPQVGIPFGLGIFLALRHSEKIAQPRQQDKNLIPLEGKHRHFVVPQPRFASALHDVIAGRKQRIAAESKNHG